MSKGYDFQSSFVSKLASATNEQVGLKQLSKVMERYAYVNGQPMSFVDHEFQIEIANDVSRRMAVQKCSQIGLSELSLQKTLAMAVSLSDVSIMYSMPTRTMAQKFSNGRFDPAISNSPHYSKLVATAKNSVEQKQIGSSILYVVGTWGANDAISIPATVVINDEIDFSNQEVLGKMSSRLRHQKQDKYGNGGYRQMFSTPTVDDFGINAEFKAGDQKYYMVRCKCGEWQVPDYFSQMVLPGFDFPIEQWTRSHFISGRYDTLKAKLLCCKCGKCLFETGSIQDPANRQWVARHPDRNNGVSSYQIYPWDLPAYNTPTSTLNSIKDYYLEEDYFNFVLGMTRTTDESMFQTNGILRDSLRSPVYIPFDPTPGIKVPEGEYYIGMDVGKVCHIVVTTMVEGQPRVVNAMTITNGTTTLRSQAMAVFDFYQPKHMCIDAGPDNSLVTDLVEYGKGRIHAVEYANSVDGLKVFVEKDPSPTGDYFRCLRADRTKLIGLVMKEHNSEQICYPSAVIDEVFNHLKGLRRTRNPDTTVGKLKFRYEKIGEDHYAHALCYSRLAQMFVEEGGQGGISFAMPPTVSLIRGRNKPGQTDIFSKYR